MPLLSSLLLLSSLALLTACDEAALAPPPDPLAERLPELDEGAVAGIRADLNEGDLLLTVTPEQVRLEPSSPPPGWTPEQAAALSLPLDAGRFPEAQRKGTLATPLYDALRDRADLYKEHGIEEFRGDLWLVVDRQVPAETLQVVMYSAGQAQFSRYHLVTFGAAVAAAASSPSPAIRFPPTPTRRATPISSRRTGQASSRMIGSADQEARFFVEDRGATFRITLDEGDGMVSSADLGGLLADPSDPLLHASYAEAAEAARYPVLPSLEMLLHVSKLADDALMADVARQDTPGRIAWLEELHAAADAAGQGEARAWLSAALALAGDEALGAEGAARAAAFQQGDPLKARPLGIYAEAEDLRRVFQRDRWLADPLNRSDAEQRAVADGLADVLDADPALAEQHAALMAAQAALTNPPGGPTVRDRAAPAVHLLPPARSREVDLINALGGSAAAGGALMDLFVAAVRDGSVDLTPTPEDGWYTHQQWALEPLLTLPERDVLSMGPGYVRRLEEAFKAAIASRRETHVKDLMLPAIGAAMPVRVPVYVAPSLRVEPTPSHYGRSAVAYDFLIGEGGVLDQHKGPGWREWPSAGGLAEAAALYAGAEAVSRADLGLLSAEEGQLSAASIQADRWLAGWAEDPRMAEDVRFMVPISQVDGEDGFSAWGVLGVRTVDVLVAYDTPPVVEALPDSPLDIEVKLTEAGYTLLVPVFAEFRTAEPHDREAFRALADQHQHKRALLDALRR